MTRTEPLEVEFIRQVQAFCECSRRLQAAIELRALCVMNGGVETAPSCLAEADRPNSQLDEATDTRLLADVQRAPEAAKEVRPAPLLHAAKDLLGDATCPPADLIPPPGDPEGLAPSSPRPSAVTAPANAPDSFAYAPGTECIYPSVVQALGFNISWAAYCTHVRTHAKEPFATLVPQLAPHTSRLAVRFACAPCLPLGLHLDTGSGKIIGDPKQPTADQVYEVTMHDAATSSILGTSALRLEVLARQPPSTSRHGHEWF